MNKIIAAVVLAFILVVPNPALIKAEPGNYLSATPNKGMCASVISDFRRASFEKGYEDAGSFGIDVNVRRYLHYIAQIMEVPQNFFSRTEYISMLFSNTDEGYTFVLVITQDCGWKLHRFPTFIHDEIMTKILTGGKDA